MKKTPLKAKTGLKRNKALQPSKDKKPRKRLTLDQKTAQQLLKDADRWFSWYVRLRDSDFIDGEGWYAPCITHDGVYLVRDIEGKWKGNTNAGHFVSRGHHIVRFDERNVNHQCVGCNKWKGGCYTEYKVAVDEKYGEGTAAELEKLAIDNKNYRCGKAELLQVIEDCKTRIDYLTKHELSANIKPSKGTTNG
jgi:hypothetical protein